MRTSLPLLLLLAGCTHALELQDLEARVQKAGIDIKKVGVVGGLGGDLKATAQLYGASMEFFEIDGLEVTAMRFENEKAARKYGETMNAKAAVKSAVPQYFAPQTATVIQNFVLLARPPRGKPGEDTTLPDTMERVRKAIETK